MRDCSLKHKSCISMYSRDKGVCIWNNVGTEVRWDANCLTFFFDSLKPGILKTTKTGYEKATQAQMKVQHHDKEGKSKSKQRESNAGEQNTEKIKLKSKVKRGVTKSKTRFKKSNLKRKQRIRSKDKASPITYKTEKLISSIVDHAYLYVLFWCGGMG